MKLPARRSLLHGTVGAVVAVSTRRTSSQAAAWSSYDGGSGKPCSPTTSRYHRCRANMSNSLTNRGPAWRRRTASAARASTAGSWKSSSVSVRPGRNSSTVVPSSGRCSSTPAPTPASAAASVLACSASRSIASSPASLRTCRTTTSWSSSTTCRLRLVRPPGSSRTSRARTRRTRSWSNAAVVAGSVTLGRSAVECLDHGFVDRVLGPLEPVLRGDLPPDGKEDQGADGHDRGVVDELPFELATERVGRRGRRQHQVDRHDDDLGDGDRVHPPVLT